MKAFLSYASDDQALARLISQYLSEVGIEIWNFEDDLNLGANFATSISKEIRDADVILFLVSRSSIASPGAQWEIAVATASKSLDNSKRIIPLLADNVNLPSFLAQYLYLDLRNRDELAIKLEELSSSLLTNSYTTNSMNGTKDTLEQLHFEQEHYSKLIEEISTKIERDDRRFRLIMMIGLALSIVCLVIAFILRTTAASVALLIPAVSLLAAFVGFYYGSLHNE